MASMVIFEMIMTAVKTLKVVVNSNLVLFNREVNMDPPLSYILAIKQTRLRARARYRNQNLLSSQFDVHILSVSTFM